jgi:hypothetical protein
VSYGLDSWELSQSSFGYIGKLPYVGMSLYNLHIVGLQDLGYDVHYGAAE